MSAGILVVDEQDKKDQVLHISDCRAPDLWTYMNKNQLDNNEEKGQDGLDFATPC